MVDGKGRCGDSSVALGHFGVLTEALSSSVGDWEIRLVEAEEPELAQQAAHIRGLLARAAEELDRLAADLAEEAARTEEGEPGAAPGGDGHVNAPHLRMLRRTHLHLPSPVAAAGGAGGAGGHPHHRHHGKGQAEREERRTAHGNRWDEPDDVGDAEGEVEVDEAEYERHHRR